jgi:hypothetical protein
VIPVTVDVTAADLLLGEPGNACFCPVALAVRRAIPGARVAVWGERVEVNGRPYLASGAVGVWVRSYDQRAQFGGPEPLPFSFGLWISEDEFQRAEMAGAA